MRLPDERVEVRLAGTGGQGVILAGMILAEAAMLDGRAVVQVQNYGPEARGGASVADVVISTHEVDYPQVLQADVLIALSQEALHKFAAGVREDGLILTDEEVDLMQDDRRVVRLPLTRLAFAASGRAIAANIVALGAVTALTGLVSRPALETAVKRRAPRGTEAVNMKALEAGFAAVETDKIATQTTLSR